MIDHEHQWDTWMPYDDHVIEMGMTDGFCYHRSCKVLGCNAGQKTERLVPAGKFDEVKDSGQ